MKQEVVDLLRENPLSDDDAEVIARKLQDNLAEFDKETDSITSK